ncbi:acyl carrier protein [Actinokineospora globicatena]|uniref:Carrier domain-containing protein n=1 Tax=Actinokineospora globicatena TaxID=103729 RepID=A0A9W6QI47_9PSEU|nr:acyl carrier protein [Actinokineospora globicatena]MCP2303345.1 acyl carrier protein [Actinokineospora globicatena]GLW79522.1 hypothetical protein Aglo01_40040 [Actinokineospora globicatena]GLW86068.1 hypothetical protein Aglo02_37070 [Actinokineospora globicatena]GLW90135.1 hypothetical protein Aglo03_09510 [Actinokineospora globicatena]
MTSTIPTAEAVVDELRAVLPRVLAPADLAKVDLAAVDLTTPLLSLPIDSAALLELMTRIEDRFRVFISDEQAFAFTTVGEVVDHVRAKALAKQERKRAAG